VFALDGPAARFASVGRSPDYAKAQDLRQDGDWYWDPIRTNKPDDRPHGTPGCLPGATWGSPRRLFRRSSNEEVCLRPMSC